MSMAATLAEHPSAASAFADMPLVDLLALVPPGALTRDVFGVGHEPGWFFDKWYATGVDANADASDTSKIPSRRSHGGSNATGGASREPAPAPHAVALRSGFEFALPLAGYATADDRRDAQEAAYRAFARRFTQLFAPDGAVCADARAAGLRVLHAGGGISEDEAAALVLGDSRSPPSRSRSSSRAWWRILGVCGSRRTPCSASRSPSRPRFSSGASPRLPRLSPSSTLVLSCSSASDATTRSSFATRSRRPSPRTRPTEVAEASFGGGVRRDVRVRGQGDVRDVAHHGGGVWQQRVQLHPPGARVGRVRRAHRVRQLRARADAPSGVDGPPRERRDARRPGRRTVVPRDPAARGGRCRPGKRRPGKRDGKQGNRRREETREDGVRASGRRGRG